ncbi:fungal pheromone STE3G-protein-coupled receptor [Peniophora sp. CONT]|nr:fungal pheromone STE3G-protein-coupled receptor [Peniophora sp. CONT]
MGAVDPTYPLYPVAELLSSVMLFLVLTTNLARQKWNLGVTSLCFWLFLESLAEAISAIVWSDDADVKLYVYCDIVTHVNVIAYVVKPMATLMITRRLYLIASLRSVEPPTQAEKLWDLALEWTLGLVIPLLVAGPIYFVNQYARFLVIAGFGCTTATGLSVVELLVMDTWPIIPPLVSVRYSAKVVRIFYRQGRDVNSFLRTNSSVSRTNYFRILALASIDVLLTLPIGIVNVSLSIVGEQTGGYPFVYPGWTFIHTDWEPESITYDEFRVSKGFGTLVQTYFSQWSSPVLAFTIFGLFGLTSEARTLYWRITCNIGGWFGWSPSPRAGKGQASLGEIEFGARPQNTSASDPEMGYVRYYPLPRTYV